MITTLLENPLKASAGVRISNSTKSINEHKAIRSDRIFPIMKKIADNTKIIIVTSIVFIEISINGGPPSCSPLAMIL